MDSFTSNLFFLQTDKNKIYQAPENPNETNSNEEIKQENTYEEKAKQQNKQYWESICQKEIKNEQIKNIFEQLQQNTEFCKKYKITYKQDHKILVIEVKRKEKSLEELTTYNPYIKLENCPVKYFYKIMITAWMVGELSIYPYTINQISNKYQFAVESIIPYKKTNCFYNFDIEGIISYIENTEYTLMFENNANNVVAYNTIWPVWSGKI